MSPVCFLSEELQRCDQIGLRFRTEFKQVADLPAASGVTQTLIGWLQQRSELPSVRHGFLYLPVELGDDSVFVGINSGP